MGESQKLLKCIRNTTAEIYNKYFMHVNLNNKIGELQNQSLE